MGFILQRRGLLVTGGIVALLVLTVLLGHGTASSSVGDSGARWWSSLGVEAPSWGGPTYSPGSIVCPQAQDSSATTLDNAFVTLEEGGRFVGRETRYLRGLPGYSLFENVYTMGGMMVAVTSNPSSLPPVTKIMSDMSRGTPENPFPVADATRWLVLSPAEAAKRLNRREAARLVGTTVFINDGPGPEGYLAHYFHLAAELFAGAWRVLSAAPDLMAKGSAMGMEFPRRVILGKGQDWRDVPGLNAWFMATMFPMMAVEDSMQWNDRSLSENLYIFDQIVILDRWASHRHNPTTMQWNKMNGDVFRAVDAPADWWAPVRQSMMRNLGIRDPAKKDKASVVYISRQAAAKRRLTPQAHDDLVAAIRAIPSVELHAPQMELLSKREQMRLVSQADVVIGVHGNGLTNEIWMKPGGAVIEIFDVGGFTRDYQLLTEPLRHSYYPIWNDKIYDWAADVPGFKLSDNFQSTTLTVSAPLVRGLIEELLASKTVDPNRPAHLDSEGAAHLDDLAAATHAVPPAAELPGTPETL